MRTENLGKTSGGMGGRVRVGGGGMWIESWEAKGGEGNR
jgi:hypothetical protein